MPTSGTDFVVDQDQFENPAHTHHHSEGAICSRLQSPHRSARVNAQKGELRIFAYQIRREPVSMGDRTSFLQRAREQLNVGYAPNGWRRTLSMI